jgi:hypothetical protein
MKFDFCVSHNYTQRDLLLPPSSSSTTTIVLNGSKRMDLRFWKTDTIPTKVGVSLSLPQWKVLYSAMQVVDDLIS